MPDKELRKDGHLVLEFDRLRFKFSYCISTCSVRYGFPHWNIGNYNTGSHVGHTIIIVWVPILSVSAEHGLSVPICKYRQLQYGCPYRRHSLRIMDTLPTGHFAYYLDISPTRLNLRCNFDN